MLKALTPLLKGHNILLRFIPTNGDGKQQVWFSENPQASTKRNSVSFPSVNANTTNACASVILEGEDYRSKVSINIEVKAGFPLLRSETPPGSIDLLVLVLFKATQQKLEQVHQCHPLLTLA